MRLMNYKVLIIAVLVGFALFNGPAMATDVGGIIDTDTTWDLAGSPFNITSTVQISENTTLTIEPGVVVNGFHKSFPFDIQVWGTLRAIGTNIRNITFNNVTISAGAQYTGTLNIQFAQVNSGAISTFGLGSPESLILLDSIIQNSEYIYLYWPSNDCNIERNIFTNTRMIDISLSGAAKVYIRNNVFYEPRDAAIWNKGDTTPPNTVIEHNTFLSNGRIALKLGTSPNAKIDARNNYWNTTDTTIIDSMIYDRNDDLNVTNYVEYVPILTEPHPDTPIPNFNQAPTSECGTDQEFFDEVAFDEVTLDGSGSSDPDGSIVSYDWTLQHRTNPDNDKSATGVNPTVTGLSNGFYDVCLTVTDDLGATNIDCSLLAAAGSCFCTPSKMHIESITAGIIKGKYGKVTVTVFDDCGSPLPGAEVTGTFSGDFNETGSGVTDANGVAVIMTTAAVSKPSYTFCVDDVVKGSLTYEPNDNVETCESK